MPVSAWRTPSIFESPRAQVRDKVLLEIGERLTPDKRECNMPGQRDQQKQQAGQRGQQQGSVVSISGHQGRQKPEQVGHQQRGRDQILFYDDTLKKELQGSFKSDGRSIHIFSIYGTKSASYGDLGPCIDYNAQVLLAQKLLSELARAAGGGH